VIQSTNVFVSFSSFGHWLIGFRGEGFCTSVTDAIRWQKLSRTFYKNLHPVSMLAISPFCDLEDAIKTGEQDNVCASGAPEHSPELSITLL
jgi:hypothetical protein